MDIYNHYSEKEDVKLHSVFDLTNTDKYYDPTLLPCQHFKRDIPGGTCPPDEYMDELFKEVDQILSKPPVEDSCIGFHCTHGVNRTGYIIIRILLHLYPKMELKTAMEKFEESRFPHEIDKKDLIDDLKSRYADRK